MSAADWAEGPDGLMRTFRFAGFPEAFAFMTRVAFEAERLNHHPEWTNVHGTVHIRLRTRDAGGTVTARDRALAAAIDVIAKGRE